MRFVIFILMAIGASVSVAAQSDSNSIEPGGISAPYALLYVYRPGQFYGSATAYNVHLGDSIICRIKNNSKCIVKLFHEGPTKLWAKFPSRYEVELNVKFGDHYFLSCGVNASLMAIKDESIGQKEFDAIKGRKDKNDDDKSEIN